ncbi:MAG TPA: hypothetical protein VMM13_19060 [Euzebya sp.]|nr:hypothetical protein [Euzebya sp.]
MTANPSDQPESATDETTPSSTPPSAPSLPQPADTPDPGTAEPAAPADTPDPGTAEPEASADIPDPAPAEPEASGDRKVPDDPAEVPVVEATSAEAVRAETVPDSPAAAAPATDTGPTPVEPPSDTDAEPTADAEPPADAEPAAADGTGQGRKKKRKGKSGGQDAAATDAPKEKQPEKKKPAGPDPTAITRQIGKTSEAALAYVANPDPKLARMSRKHREAVITEIPPVTAGALLGPEALCRHFLASAASGRYRDLFFLWELFVAFPEDCKPVLASRQRAQEKARAKLRTATHLGLLGDADRVAADIDRASGLPWRWMREILEPMAPAIRQRPAVLAAILRRIPDFDVEVPDEPSDRWLAEAAALKESAGEIPPAVDALLGAHADRLPATVATLSMAQEQYPDRVPALIDRVDLAARDIAAMMAWARDHGHGQQLTGRIAADIDAAVEQDRATGLAAWKRWQGRGVDLPMPQSLAAPTLEGLDLGRPESAELIKVLVDNGADIDPQQILDRLAGDNRMLGEKAFEAFVCAGFDQVHLPLALEGNPMVRPETRCPACQAWTWVRPGLEKRCPRTGCPLRAGQGTAAASPEEDLAAIDAAVASIDPGSWSGAADAEASESQAVAEAVLAPARPTPPPPDAARPATTAPPAAVPEAPAPQAPSEEAPQEPGDTATQTEAATAETQPTASDPGAAAGAPTTPEV